MGGSALKSFDDSEKSGGCPEQFVVGFPFGDETSKRGGGRAIASFGPDQDEIDGLSWLEGADFQGETLSDRRAAVGDDADAGSGLDITEHGGQ